MNEGKKMEAAWRKCAKRVDGLYYQRMNDGTATFYGGQAQEGIRFQKSSPYDCFMYKEPILFLLELKRHLGGSLPFSAIRDQQLKELSEAQQKGVVAGFVVMFADKELCYFASGEDVLKFKESAERKSIPIAWFEEHGVEIAVKKLRENYTYDVAEFVDCMKRRMIRNNV